MASSLVFVCRDAEVLSLFAAIINKLRDRMQKEVPKIFEAVFQVTLQMITKDFSVSQPFWAYLHMSPCVRITCTALLMRHCICRQSRHCNTKSFALHMDWSAQNVVHLFLYNRMSAVCT